VALPFRRFSRLLVALAAAAMPFAAWAAAAAATKLEAVADTRDLGSGVSKMLADTYNSNLWVFGVCVVVIMAGMGLVLGYVVDRLMRLTGIELGKMEHRE
jgi:hypothetical protein